MHASLPKAVQSVADQDYDDIELIVIDDGSDISPDWEQLQVKGITFTYFEIEHGGKPKAVNKGFEEAEGDYLTILDADDQLPQNSISQRLEQLLENDADLCIGSFETSYKGSFQSLRSVKRLVSKSPEELVRAFMGNILSPFHQNAMLFHRDLLEEVGMMDPDMIRGQDKDFAIRLIKNTRQIIFVEESVYIYNRYDRSFTIRIGNRLTGMKYLLRIAARHFDGWRRAVYLLWIFLLEIAKLVYDVFGSYKK